MGASPNFEKRVLASIQQQPNCLQPVYMMQNLQLDLRTFEQWGKIYH